VLAAIEHRHNAISHVFCSDAGVRLMRVDKRKVAQSSVAKYMVKRRGPPSQGWRTFRAIIIGRTEALKSANTKPRVC
jgi:hypothetical protein